MLDRLHAVKIADAMADRPTMALAFSGHPAGVQITASSAAERGTAAACAALETLRLRLGSGWVPAAAPSDGSMTEAR